MDLLSRIASWLGQSEATISAVVGITVLVGIVLAGLRALHLRGATEALRKLLAGSTRRTRFIAAGAGVLLVVAGVAACLVLPDQPEREAVSEEDPVLALPTGPVVAVLPFENLSRDPDQEFFSDGLTDGIITALSRFKDFFVIARNSTFRYKGKPVDIRRLNEELGAQYVLEGSVQKSGATLRVTVQLLEAKDGTHPWADTYGRELSASNIFAVQDEITDQVAATIGSVYGVISRERFAASRGKPASDLSAYECTLQMGTSYRGNFVATEHARIRDCLERAVESDPNYAEAWAWLAHLYLDEYRYDFNARPNPLDRALKAAQQAVASDPTSQLAHDSLADTYFHRHEMDAFFAEVERAIALNPNNVSVLAGLGDRLHSAGDERGIAWVRKAMKLDPFHPTWLYYSIAHYHFERGEYDQAIAAAKNIDSPGSYWLQISLSATYAELGRESEARSAMKELLRRYPGFTAARYIEEARKWNYPDDSIRLWLAALRKAGLPE